jgi:hypothetical protein
MFLYYQKHKTNTGADPPAIAEGNYNPYRNITDAFITGMTSDNDLGGRGAANDFKRRMLFNKTRDMFYFGMSMISDATAEIYNNRRIATLFGTLFCHPNPLCRLYTNTITRFLNKIKKDSKYNVTIIYNRPAAGAGAAGAGAAGAGAAAGAAPEEFIIPNRLAENKTLTMDGCRTDEIEAYLSFWKNAANSKFRMFNYFIFIWHIGSFTDYNQFLTWINDGCIFNRPRGVHPIIRNRGDIRALNITLAQYRQLEVNSYFYISKLLALKLDSKLFLSNQIGNLPEITNPAIITPQTMGIWTTKNMFNDAPINTLMGIE